jgi:DnaJ-class molecular chaperone
MDLYRILNVDKKSSKQEIKKSYYRLAKRYHPDKFNGSDSQFKKINLAYQILSDDNLRLNYDSNKQDNLYEIFQTIIKNNNLDIVNDFFGFIYNDFSELEDDVNKLNFGNLYKKIKLKSNLDIIKKININIEDIYFDRKLTIEVKRSINNKFCNYTFDLDLDIYDEELFYDNLGDELLFLKGNLILKLNILKKDNYHILDEYNLLVEEENLNFDLFDKIKLENLKFYCKNNNSSVYKLENYGFLQKECDKKGDLYIKILH